MATKTLNTRIKNRLDTLANWKAEGVELLAGEIALVSVTTQQIDYTTGNVVNVPAVLMKVGENDASGKPKSFSSLPWLSAKAADVYAWAKTEHAKDIKVEVITGKDQEGKDVVDSTTTLGAWLANLNTATTAVTAEISAVAGKLSGIDDTVADAISAAIEALDGTITKDTEGNDTTGNFVKAVTQADGIVDVTYGDITESDLPNISASKIIVTPASGTEGHEGYKAAVTVADKFNAVDGEISSLKSSVAGGVHFVGITTTALTDGSTTSTITINGKPHIATNGDVVIYQANVEDAEDREKEFIWVKLDDSDTGHWEALGDLTRVGELETLIGGIISSANKDDSNYKKVDHEFVTHFIENTDGALVAQTARPTAEDVIFTEASGETQAVTVKGKFSSVDSDVSAIKSNYMRIGDDDNIYEGTEGPDGNKVMIIFNCGNASSWITEA